MWMYDVEAVGLVAGQPVSVTVDADVLPPHVLQVQVAQKMLRRKQVLSVELVVETDSVLFLDGAREVISVMFTVTGVGRGWEREHFGFVFQRDGPPSQAYTVTVPWPATYAIDNIEAHFYPHELDAFVPTDVDDDEDDY